MNAVAIPDVKSDDPNRYVSRLRWVQPHYVGQGVNDAVLPPAR